jgi:hypothetical protein
MVFSSAWSRILPVVWLALSTPGRVIRHAGIVGKPSNEEPERVSGGSYRPPVRVDRVQIGAYVSEEVRDALNRDNSTGGVKELAGAT